MPIENLQQVLTQIAYPGDTPDESDVLRGYLVDHGQLFDRIEFNVHLGQGAIVGGDVDEKFQNLMRRWTQLRCDAILFQEGRATLVEVKKRGLSNAMGQLLAYRLAYMAQHPEQTEPSMLLVCASITEEMVAIMEAHGIAVAVVEPLTPREV